MMHGPAESRGGTRDNTPQTFGRFHRRFPRGASENSGGRGIAKNPLSFVIHRRETAGSRAARGSRLKPENQAGYLRNEKGSCGRQPPLLSSNLPLDGIVCSALFYHYHEHKRQSNSSFCAIVAALDVGGTRSRGEFSRVARIFGLSPVLSFTCSSVTWNFTCFSNPCYIYRDTYAVLIKFINKFGINVKEYCKDVLSNDSRLES